MWAGVGAGGGVEVEVRPPKCTPNEYDDNGDGATFF